MLMPTIADVTKSGAIAGDKRFPRRTIIASPRNGSAQDLANKHTDIALTNVVQNRRPRQGFNDLQRRLNHSYRRNRNCRFERRQRVRPKLRRAAAFPLRSNSARKSWISGFRRVSTDGPCRSKP